MFNKVEEYTKGTGTGLDLKTFVKKYNYQGDLDLFAISRMIEESKCPVEFIDVYSNDEIGNGRYTFDNFYSDVNEIYSDVVSFEMPSISTSISIRQDNNELFLYFWNVDQMPETEITDLISEKKMNF